MVKVCTKCQKSVYPLEELKCLDKVWHKACFKCTECQMLLNVKTYKGYNKMPYCVAHYPQSKATTVAETPELARIAQNTKIQSQVKYHEDFEKNIRGSKIEVADDPVTQRVKKVNNLISQLEYKGNKRLSGGLAAFKTSVSSDVGGSVDAKNNNAATAAEQPQQQQLSYRSKAMNSLISRVASNDVSKNSGSENGKKYSPFKSRCVTNSTIYGSDGTKAQTSRAPAKKVGSIADYDPVNENYGSLAGGYKPKSRSSASEDTEFPTSPTQQQQESADVDIDNDDDTFVENNNNVVIKNDVVVTMKADEATATTTAAADSKTDDDNDDEPALTSNDKNDTNDTSNRYDDDDDDVNNNNDDDDDEMKLALPEIGAIAAILAEDCINYAIQRVGGDEDADDENVGKNDDDDDFNRYKSPERINEDDDDDDDGSYSNDDTNKDNYHQRNNNNNVDGDEEVSNGSSNKTAEKSVEKVIQATTIVPTKLSNPTTTPAVSNATTDTVTTTQSADPANSTTNQISLAAVANNSSPVAAARQAAANVSPKAVFPDKVKSKEVVTFVDESFGAQSKLSVGTSDVMSGIERNTDGGARSRHDDEEDDDVNGEDEQQENDGDSLIAMYDYEPDQDGGEDDDDNENIVSFRENDVIDDVTPIRDGWCMGTVRRTQVRGYIPCNYLRNKSGEVYEG